MAYAMEEATRAGQAPATSAPGVVLAFGREPKDGKEDRFTQVLREFGMKETHIRAVQQRQALTNESLTDIMCSADYGFLTPEKIAQVNARMDGLAYLPPAAIDEIDPERIPQAAWPTEFRHWVPIDYDAAAQCLTVAISEIEQENIAKTALPDYLVRYRIASHRTIQSIYRQCFARTEAAFDVAYGRMRELMGREDDPDAAAALGELIMTLIRHACYMQASDIGLTPMATSTGAMVRLKVGGVGDFFRFLEWPIWKRIITYLITRSGRQEKLRDEPVDGKIEFTSAQEKKYAEIKHRYAFRVSLTRQVESPENEFTTVVIRILDKDAEAAELDQIGMDPHTLQRLRGYMQADHGIFLTTGPTGSGKTSAIYALLNEVDPIERWVQSSERPIEYRKGSWIQYQVPGHKDEGEAAQLLLKGILRNAPNIILNGETRDAEIAALMLEMANTGHLTLSTQHNNRAETALTRLKNFGVDMTDVAAVLLGILALRLVRKLCTRCSVPDAREATRHLLRHDWLADTPHRPRRAGPGCRHCNHTGYRGRQLVYELLHVDPQVRRLIERQALPSEIAAAGLPPHRRMTASALRLLSAGITSHEAIASILATEVEEAPDDYQPGENAWLQSPYASHADGEAAS
ncbi:ATPase, T2SS/T4P/T4SS family [Pandoraea sp.]|uniref:GspE/PulE family protein n=1 Tax=Pandoraea sp. TaxID=1883445 RepID=UPI0025D68B62|nr:ATPase, T2SS/T4P/T4SS family [Pandoraea sp.]